MTFENINAKKQLRVKASYSIDENILKKFNEYAKIEKLNKSRTVENLLRVFIENVEKKEKA